LSRIIHQIVGSALGEYVGIFVAEGVAEGEEAVRYLMGYCAREHSGSAARGLDKYKAKLLVEGHKTL